MDSDAQRNSAWGMLILGEQHPVYYQELRDYRDAIRKEQRNNTRQNRSLFVGEGEFAAPLSKAVCNAAIPEAGDAPLFGQPWALQAEAAPGLFLQLAGQSSGGGFAA